MKFSWGTISFLGIALVFISLPSGSTQYEICDPLNCVPAEDCEEPINESCGDSGTVCCNMLKESAMKLCHHHGGICMPGCGETLMRDTTDCTDGSVCCVLV